MPNRSLPNQLAAIALFLCPLPLAAQPEQAEDAALMKRAGIKSASYYWLAPLDVLDKTGGKLYTRQYFDRSGRLIRTENYYRSDTIQAWTEHAYDRKGLLVRTTRGSTGSDTTTTHYTYNAKRLQTSVRAQGRGMTSLLDSTEYDSGGRRTKYISYNPDGSISHWTHYSYDAKGLVYLEKNYSGYTGKESYVLRYLYDSNGNQTGKKVVSGSVRATYPVQEYGERGRLRRETYFNPDTTVHSTMELVWSDTLLAERKMQFFQVPKTVVSKYAYHANGLLKEQQIIEHEQRDEDDEINTYNEKGERVKRSYLRAGKELSQVLYRYDEEGRLVDEEQLSAEGKMDRRILHTYSSEGLLQSQTVIIPAIYGWSKGRRRGTLRDGLDTTVTRYAYKDGRLQAEYDYVVTTERPQCLLSYGRLREIRIDDWDDPTCGFAFSVLDTLEHRPEKDRIVTRLKLGIWNPRSYDDSAVNECMRTIIATAVDTLFVDTDASGLELLRIEQEAGVYRVRRATSSYTYKPQMEIKWHHRMHIAMPYDTVFYNKAGEKIKQLSNEPGSSRIVRAWKYSEGRLVQEDYHNRTYKQRTIMRHFLNDAGELTETRVFDGEGEQTGTKKYSWAGGKLLRKTLMSPPALKMYRCEYERY